MEMGPVRMILMGLFVLGIELIIGLLSPVCFSELPAFFFLLVELWLIGLLLGIIGKFIFKFKRIGFAILTGILSAYFWFPFVSGFANWLVERFGYYTIVPFCLM